LEIVVEHEIEAFLFRGGEEEEEIDDLSILSIFEDLIAEKWNKFGRAFHIIWVMLPHVLVLLAYLFLLTVRVPAIYERQHIGYKFPNVITGGLGYNNQLYDSANQNWVCPVFFCLGIPFLLFQAYLEARVRPVDLDPDSDDTLTFQEILWFSFKNVGAILNATTAVAMLVQAGMWVQTRDLSENGELLVGNLSLEEALHLWKHEMQAMAFVCLMLLYIVCIYLCIAFYACAYLAIYLGLVALRHHLFSVCFMRCRMLCSMW